METKKNKKYDLESKRPLFFGIGLFFSLSFVIAAFEWKSEIDPIVDWGTKWVEWETPILIDPTIQATPKPPKPKVHMKPIQTVEAVDEPKEDKEMYKVHILPPDDWTEPIIFEGIPSEIAEEPPRNYAEVMPSYRGGMEQFYKFIGEQIKYPRQAQSMGVEGKVFVRFVVEKDGSLSNIEVVKGIGAGCDAEALRVMNIVENFTPAKQGDIRVRVQMIIPIYFRLH